MKKNQSNRFLMETHDLYISQCYGQLSSAVDSMNISYDLKVKQIYNFKKAKGYSRWML